MLARPFQRRGRPIRWRARTARSRPRRASAASLPGRWPSPRRDRRAPVGHPLGDRLAGERLAGERNIADGRVQLPARAGIASPLLDQELGQRRTVGEHGVLQVIDVGRVDRRRPRWPAGGHLPGGQRQPGPICGTDSVKVSRSARRVATPPTLLVPPQHQPGLAQQRIPRCGAHRLLRPAARAHRSAGTPAARPPR
jgi:hypothetical protein